MLLVQSLKGPALRGLHFSTKNSSKSWWRVLRSAMAPSATQKHRPIVISGPSGSGKSTILKRLFADHPSTFGFSVSHTTRPPREGELDGREYNFITAEKFTELIGQGAFIEHARFGSNFYGTSVQAVKSVAEKGEICVLDIEMEGVKQVKKTDLNARFLFLSPPSLEILEERLRGRGTDKEEDIIKRLNQAKNEMAFSNSEDAPFEKTIVNDDLDKAYKEVKDWVIDGRKYGGLK